MLTLEAPDIDVPARELLHPLPLRPLAQRPLVSVLVTNYNYAAFLPAALDSLIAQDYEHWEAIVCDDGSTDASVQVIRSYAALEPRIRLVVKKNGGQNAAVNECHRHLMGDLICLLDADDFFAPEKLSHVVAAFVARPSAGFCHHFARVVDGRGDELPVTLSHRLDAGWLAETANNRGGCVYVPTTSSMCFRREVLDELMPIPAMQPRDADGYLGMAAQFLTPFVRVDEKLAAYRVHGKNMGGLTEPTPQRLQYELELIGQRTATLRWFLAGRFGELYSQQIRKEDNPQYIQAALKLHAVSRVDSNVLINARILIARHPNAKWRAIWQFIFAFPRPLRRRIMPAMHRSHRVKAVIQKVLVRSSVRHARSFLGTGVLSQ